MSDHVPPSTAITRGVERVLRYGIVSVFVVGVRRRDPGAIINALLAFVAASLPDAIEHWYDVEFRPWQRAYASIAMLMHAVGMLGPYDDVWWWDHLTHTFSATLLSGIVYTASRHRGRDPQPDVIGAVVSLGTLWELMEYLLHALANRLGYEPVLVAYGPIDAALDLVFDLVGAVLVLVVGDCVLENFLESTSRSP